MEKRAHLLLRAGEDDAVRHTELSRLVPQALPLRPVPHDQETNVRSGDRWERRDEAVDSLPVLQVRRRSNNHVVDREPECATDFIPRIGGSERVEIQSVERDLVFVSGHPVELCRAASGVGCVAREAMEEPPKQHAGGAYWTLFTGG